MLTNMDLYNSIDKVVFYTPGREFCVGNRDRFEIASAKHSKTQNQNPNLQVCERATHYQYQWYMLKIVCQGPG